MFKTHYKQVQVKSNQATQAYRIQSAEGSAQREGTSKILLRSGMTGIEFICKLPQCVATFKAEDDCWRFLDPAQKPPFAGPGQQDLAVSLENEYANSTPLNTGVNLHYLNVCWGIANFEDTQKLVILLNEINHSSSVHNDVRQVASLHSRIASTWPVLINAILVAYATLLNSTRSPRTARFRSTLSTQTPPP
ncbi:hypothetical protein B484DRAFT_431226 [Ochromonadaceae sp. CCMP2298]|nr:hypothetical protein B484DRAFT_431226 [Ochromonadaceae sp. CCMP2298]